MNISIPLGKVTADERAEGFLSHADSAWQRSFDLHERVRAADEASLSDLCRVILESGMLDTRCRSVFSSASLACRAATIRSMQSLTVNCTSNANDFDAASPLALWLLVNKSLLVSLASLTINAAPSVLGVGCQASTVVSAIIASGCQLQEIRGTIFDPSNLLADIAHVSVGNELPWSSAPPAVWDESTETPVSTVRLIPALLSANSKTLTSIESPSLTQTCTTAAAGVLDLTGGQDHRSSAQRLVSAGWASCLHHNARELQSVSAQWDYDLPAPMVGDAGLFHANRAALKHVQVLVSRGATPHAVSGTALERNLLLPVTKPFVEQPATEGQGGALDAEEAEASSEAHALHFEAAESATDPALDTYPKDAIGVLPAITMPETFPLLWCRGLQTLHVHIATEQCVSIADDAEGSWALHNAAIPAVAATIEANTSTLKHLSITGVMGANHVSSHALLAAISRCRLQSLALHLSFPWHNPEAFAWAAKLAAEDIASSATEGKESAPEDAPVGLFTDWRRDVCPDVAAAVKAESVFADDLQVALQQQARSLRKLHLTVNSAPEVAAFNVASKNLKRISDLSVSVAGRLCIDPTDSRFSSVEWPVAPPAGADDASTTTASTLVQTYDAHSFWAGSNVPASLMATVATSGGGDDDEDDDEDEGGGKEEDLWDEDDDEDEDDDGETESKFSASLVGSVGRPFSAKSKGSRPFSARSRGSRPFSARSRGRPVSAKDRASQALTRPKRKTFPKGNIRNYAARRLDAAALLAHTLRAFPTGLRSLPISVSACEKAFPTYAHKWWWGCYLDAMRTHATTLLRLQLSGSAAWCSGTTTVLLRKLFRTGECSLKHVYLTLPTSDSLHPLIPHLLAEGLEGLLPGLQSLTIDRAAVAKPKSKASPTAAGSGSAAPAEGSQKQLKAGIGSFQGSHIGSEVSGGDMQEAGDLAPLLAVWRPVAGPTPASLRLLWDLTPAEVQALTEALADVPPSAQVQQLELCLGARVGNHRPVPEVLEDLFATLSDMQQVLHMRQLTLKRLPAAALAGKELTYWLEKLRWLQQLCLTIDNPLGDAGLEQFRQGDQQTSSVSSPQHEHAASGGVGVAEGGMGNMDPVPNLRQLQDASELADLGYAPDPLLQVVLGGAARSQRSVIENVAGLLLDASRDSIAAVHTARTQRTARKPGHEFAPVQEDIDLSVAALHLPPQHKWLSTWALQFADQLAEQQSLPCTAAFLDQVLTALMEIQSSGLTRKMLLQSVRGYYPRLQQLQLSLGAFTPMDCMAVAHAVSADSIVKLQASLSAQMADPTVNAELTTLHSVPQSSVQHSEPIDSACSTLGVSRASLSAYRRLYNVCPSFQTHIESGLLLAVDRANGNRVLLRFRPAWHEQTKPAP